MALPHLGRPEFLVVQADLPKQVATKFRLFRLFASPHRPRMSDLVAYPMAKALRSSVRAPHPAIHSLMFHIILSHASCWPASFSALAR